VILGTLIFIALAMIASAQAVPRDPGPQNATPAILAAFDKYQIVAMHAAHGLKDNDDYILSLIRDPVFPDKVNDIVVECGNGFYQNLLDRYIGAERVPLSEAQQVWRNTTGLMCSLSDFYDQLFPLVRELNQSLPARKRLRVVAADPAFEWSQVKTGADIPNNRVRATSILATMEREVLSKKRRALMLFGINHLMHGTRSTVSMYERTYPGITFVIAPHMGLDDESQNAPAPSY
jgi:hypothetical protein